ncbi:MAG: hypothetical protein HY903_11325 [Deltaproteobacteria bacterium]|nr:hypothetical protein [Deltaproteobacteria bacterium]
MPWLLAACPAGKPANGPECSDIDNIQCPPGKTCVDFVCRAVCTKSADCAPAEACLDSSCTPYAQSCSDHPDCVADWYCSNHACAKRLPLGNPCGTVDVACATGLCMDGVCCDSACDGLCETCVAGSDTGDGDDGLCAPIPAGQDPYDLDCPGPTACDGNRGCFAALQGEACEQSYECTTGACADGLCCNGACGGVCETCATGTCEPIPDMQDPVNECTGEATCDGARGCYDSPLGAECGAAGYKCVSGHCADGVCCDRSCDGTCEQCDGPASTGTCASVLNATDVGTCDNTTGACGAADCACDAVGACKASPAASCLTGGTCASGICGDGVCCAGPCSNTCMSCNSNYTRLEPGVCSPIENGADPRNECNGTAATACNGAGACYDNPIAALCQHDYECASGSCVDGVCCLTGCSGLCSACDGVGTNQTTGLCGFINDGLERADECAGPTACRSDAYQHGVCWAQQFGDTCGANYQCASGVCCEAQCRAGWESMSSPTTERLNGVWGSAPNDVYAVGYGGTVIHFDGNNWTTVPGVPTTTDLYAVHGFQNHPIVVGMSGTILYYSGSSWVTWTADNPQNLFGVWAASSTLAYAVGANGAILKWSGGTTWTSEPGGSGELRAVTGSGSAVYAVGDIHTGQSCNLGIVLQRQSAGTWTSLGFPGACGMTAAVLNGELLVGTWSGLLTAFPPTKAGEIWRLNTGVWTDDPSQSGTVSSLAAGSSIVFGVGRATTVDEYRSGDGWTTVVATSSGSLAAVWAAGDCNVVAVGSAGLAVRFR